MERFDVNTYNIIKCIILLTFVIKFNPPWDDKSVFISQLVPIRVCTHVYTT